MVLVLVGDIGGTHVRLRLYESTDHSIVKNQVYLSAEHSGLEQALRVFLQGAQPEIAVIAAAGYVLDNTIRFVVNQQWNATPCSGEALSKALGIRQVLFMNDFVGAAYGCLELAPSDLIPLNPETAAMPRAPVAVMGAGTGIGESFLTWNGQDYTAWPTEGGCADFSPKTELQWKYLQFMQSKIHEYPEYVPVLGPPCEVVLGGQGAYQLYYFFRELFPDEADLDFEAQFEGEERTRLMMQHGLAGSNKLCERAVTLWIQTMAYEAGNLIVKVLPYGGFYMIGGMVTKNAEALASSEEFRQALHSKIPHVCEIITKVPFYFVKNLDVGLIGPYAFARRLLASQDS